MNDLSRMVTQVAKQEAVMMGWGEVVWLAGTQVTPGAEQTFGVVTIYPDNRIPLHVHPNCEELLYVVSGRCEHRLRDESVELSPGSLIRIPRGTSHHATCVGDEPLVAVISFSSPEHQTEILPDSREV